MTKRVAILFGTRPEAIKLAPVILALRRVPGITVEVCVTGQHKEMLGPILRLFGIAPDVDMRLMRANQGLADFVARCLRSLDRYFALAKPDFVLVQGDTSTVLAGCLASFYHRVPIGHVEAGLRTGAKYSPFPEEMNRVLTSRLSDYHFAPTEGAARNLMEEGVPKDRVYVTGNPVVDALLMAAAKIREAPPRIPALPRDLFGGTRNRPIVLVTGHRRENFGDGFKNICTALLILSERFPKVQFVYPVHLNPNVKEPVYRYLGGRANIHLIEPLPYLSFVALMDRAKLVLTDSGGVQEEAPSLGKPVLVMRDCTERPEGVTAGNARLVGTSVERIVESVRELLTDRKAYDAMAQARNPYGDGKAGLRIAQAVASFLG